MSALQLGGVVALLLEFLQRRSLAFCAIGALYLYFSFVSISSSLSFFDRHKTMHNPIQNQPMSQSITALFRNLPPAHQSKAIKRI